MRNILRLSGRLFAFIPFLAVFCVFVTFQADAGTSTVLRPYLNNQVDGQRVGPLHDRGTSADWTQTPGQGTRLLKKFYDIGVLEDYEYSVFSKSPVLTVGPGFYRLSRFDQNRVTDLVDFVYHGTEKKPGTIFIADRDTGKVIGLYTIYGLQLE